VSSYVSVKLRRRIRELFEDRCAYCQTAEALMGDIFEIEHIIPRAADGETVFENLCLSCPTCNRYKSDRVSFQQKPSDSKVELFHPQQSVWSNHFRWNDDATELLGVTPIGQATIDLLRINRQQMIRVRRMWVAIGVHPPTNG
jgi:hypothetical protein